MLTKTSNRHNVIFYTPKAVFEPESLRVYAKKNVKCGKVFTVFAFLKVTNKFNFNILVFYVLSKLNWVTIIPGFRFYLNDYRPDKYMVRGYAFDKAVGDRQRY